MIQSFRSRGTENIYDGMDSKAARRTCPPDLWRIARRKLSYLDAAGALADLQRPRGNRLEALKGDREGEHGIRINDKYRICFRWTDAGPADVEIVDYH